MSHSHSSQSHHRNHHLNELTRGETAGSGHPEQPPSFSAHSEPQMDNGLEMGRQGSYLVSGGGTSSRRRKLLQVQREHPLQLPEIIDLLPTVPKDKQFPGCCKGGLLASQAQDPNTMATSFQMSVGHLRTLNITMKLPMEFHLLRPGQGYTYNASKIGPSSVFFLPDGQRRTSVMGE